MTVVPASVTLLVSVTASLYVWIPLVVTLSPSVVVPPAFVTRLAACTVLVNAVAPVLFTARAPRAPLVPAPTAPVNVTLPKPVETVRSLASLASLFTVLENSTALSVVESVMSASTVTAPV